MGQLKGKTCMITARAGLGRVTALELARMGASSCWYAAIERAARM